MTNEEILQTSKDQVARSRSFKSWNDLIRNRPTTNALQDTIALVAIKKAKDEGYKIGYSEALSGDGL